MLNTEFSPWPSFSDEEVAAVADVIRSNRVNYWTGTEGRHFETEFASWNRSAYAVALGNGTLALDVALKALRIGPGDEVVVTPRSFIASVSCVVTAGAKPVFADVDRDSQNITAATIEAALTSRSKAIICVHLAGWPCDMDAIMELAARRNLVVIEDCAQAHGASVRGRQVGSIGHVGAWSFCQDKIISTGGEGGLVTTQDESLWKAMWSYKDHGKSYDAVYNRQHPPGFRWVHETIGTNWRMLEVQAAIGRIQLRRISAWHDRRTHIAMRYKEVCDRYNVVRVPLPEAGLVHAFYRFYAFVNDEELAAGWSRDRIVAEIQARGVPCLQGSCSEIYLERAFDGSDSRPSARLPVAKELGETSLMLLVHPTLTDSEVDRICDVLDSTLCDAQGGR